MGIGVIVFIILLNVFLGGVGFRSIDTQYYAEIGYKHTGLSFAII